MSDYVSKPKDKRIRIFREITGETRRYIHPEKNADGTPYYLNAYVRQLSASEQVRSNAVHDSSVLEFRINPRSVAVDMMIEFNSKFYQVDAVDNFEFYKNTDFKILAYEVNKKTYAKTEWEVLL